MIRRHPPLLGLIVLACVAVGCDYGASNQRLKTPGLVTRQGGGLYPGTPRRPARPDDPEMRKAILDSVIQLVESAATNPGGDNFAIAVDHLNHFFERFGGDSDFAMSPEARAFLEPRLGKNGVADLEGRTFAKRDGRHLEDCLLYHAIATRVAGQGEDLDRARAIFDWTVRQVQLVPAGALAPPGLPQAQSRPYDVLMRGQATEQDGHWAERSWVFMALCRQVGIDVGLVAFTPEGRPEAETAAWFCAAAIGGRAYLFDAGLGRPIPGPDGTGIATLEEAIHDPIVLDRLDLPGLADYPVDRADLAAGPVRVLIDSGPGYLSSRMKRLQEELTGRKKVILYRDPADQRDRFARALGPRLREVTLWALPLEVEFSLFNDAKFVASAQYAIQFFDAQLPLLSARLDQLRGEMESSMLEYVRFRLVPGATLTDGKTPIPPPIHDALNMYATYYIGLCHLDQGHPDLAARMFRQAIDQTPEPVPGTPPFGLFRWGARSNLARLLDDRGEEEQALGLLLAPDPTREHLGNLLRARAIVWDDPFARDREAAPEPAPAASPEATAPEPVPTADAGSPAR